ncbi:F420-dependent oxidoreductase-like protein [Haloactinopolyspora alba]|uniref:F420-dependent oxidoreductase-like protein n=1 Tax=Haloactinopolyspora alba TaxID=648780 RepID=A0A2P8D5C8_9ACTN|nr:LLM class F420-dependent oxidoreductase [Haloactinopolyspora alba]PSK92423.1 F420-dependent oxidoreductase-like protein [Haloactinopolyspora alba]
MQVGLHIMNFSWPGGPAAIGPTLEQALANAEAAGIHSFWPMDHFFQVPIIGPPEEPMLEAYGMLAWAAGRFRTLQLGALVTGVHYRHPGVLVKQLSTLDVLSGGRAWLGIGAAWNGQESRALGVPFPSMAERYERLEETLQIAQQMFDGDDAAYTGTHYRLDYPVNHPAPVRRPPIMVGGMGERKTMSLVAKYADANNFFELPDPAALRHKLDVLRTRCDEVGRPYEDIVKTTFGQLGPLDLDHARRRFENLADLGVDLAIVDLPDPADERVYEFMAELVREVEPMGRPTPAPLSP